MTGSRRKGELPIDKDNHGMDCLRYVVAHIDGRGPALSVAYLPQGAM